MANDLGPDLGPSADLLYERVLPVFYNDGPNYAGKTLCAGLMAMFQGMDQIVLDTDTHPGWTTVLDPVTCPVKWLPWCAQIYGVVLPPGASVARQREVIEELGPQKRGTLASMVAAVAITLTGTKHITFTEFPEGKAYKINVHTLTKETPSAAATEAALLSQKPGGLILTYTVSESPSWEEATKLWREVATTVTWGNAVPGQV